MQPIEKIKQLVRKVMREIADFINRVSNGKISPNTITWLGLVAHIPISLLIANGSYILAAGLLVIFGLFDTLDGELARLQRRASPSGMLLDASTDRMKEVILYTGVASSLISSDSSSWAPIAVIACGASLSVSYIKAKGESAVATSSKKPDHNTLNRMFSDGLATFEIRMLILVIGLLANQLLIVTGLVAVLASYTAMYRLYKISKHLSA